MKWENLMKRFIPLLAGVLLSTTILAGCGDDATSGAGDSTAAYCAKIRAYREKSDELDSVFTATPDPADVEVAFTTMQTMVRDLMSDPPAEIKNDVITMGAAIDSVIEIFSKYNWDFLALASAPEFVTLQEELGGADMTAASERLEAYSSDTCGIAPETTTA